MGSGKMDTFFKVDKCFMVRFLKKMFKGSLEFFKTRILLSVYFPASIKKSWVSWWEKEHSLFGSALVLVPTSLSSAGSMLEMQNQGP